MLRRKTCLKQLRFACDGGNGQREYLENARLFGLNIINGTKFQQLEQDIAYFQLVRGDYAYLGWGAWGMTWVRQKKFCLLFVLFVFCSFFFFFLLVLVISCSIVFSDQL